MRLYVPGTLLLLTASSLACAQSSQTRPIAFIQEIKGTVTLLRDGHELQKLDARLAQGRFLYAGETLRCAPGALARGFAADMKRGDFAPIDLCASRESAHTPGLGTYQGIADAMERAGRRAGRDKGSDVAMFSPPEQGAVIAGTFTVRWRTRPPLGTLTLILRDAQQTELARTQDVDGATGMLQSDAMRNALVRYASAGGDHTATLILHGAAATDQVVTFSVLTPAQEADLKRKLQEDTLQTGIFHFLERAAVYDSFRLYDEAAAEYAAALEQAPESRDLLQATFNAYTRIGDLRTARTLRDRLERAQDEENSSLR